MAKRKAAARSKPAKRAARMKLAKGASKGTRKALAPKKSKSAAPRRGRKGRAAEQTFPELGALKDRVLSKLAAGVADERHDQSDSKATEAGYIQSAQKRMQQLNMTVFTAHGIEFIRVPGEEKFRVRLTGDGVKDAGNGATEDKELPEPEFETDDEGKPVDESGDGEGAGAEG